MFWSFERIREELRGGRRVAQAIEAGYSRALSTIIDSNLTTLFCCIIPICVWFRPGKGICRNSVFGDYDFDVYRIDGHPAIYCSVGNCQTSKQLEL